MADREHLKVILQGPQAWNEWRKQNPHIPKDLSGADLTGLDLSNANLADVDLSLAKLNGVEFKGSASILVKANLQGADLSNADLDNAKLSEAKLQRAILNGAVLTKAQLERANLSNASLIKADLESANCKNAIFIEARLEASALNGTNFEEAKLQRAVLKGAGAARAHFEDAKLSDTCLTAVNLENADLSRAQGLVQSQLAGTNLYHAVLDPHIADFKELGRVEEIAKYSRKIFSILLILCVFSWLLIGQATDEILVTNSMVTSLPLIQASIPLASLFCFMPAFLLVIFVYLHLNLQSLWKGLANLPAVFPDGEILPRRAFPWIMTSLTYLYVPLLKDRRPAYWSLNVFLAILAAWIVPPLTVLWFYFRYAVVGDTWGAYWLIVVIFLIVWFAVDSYMLARKSFSEAGMMPTHRRTSEPKLKSLARRTKWMVPAIITGCACFWWYSELGDILNFQPMSFRSMYLFRVLDMNRFRADLGHSELSRRRPGFERNHDDNLFNVRPANLTNRRLRQAVLYGAYLVGANFTGADLTRAILSGTDLRKAFMENVTARDVQLSGANLARSSISWTDLTNANIRDATLWGSYGIFTDFTRATLQNANGQGAKFGNCHFIQTNFCAANFREASLWDADFEGARLDYADFSNSRLSKIKWHGASLKGTNLSGVDLTKAEGLESDQISQACGDDRTQLPQYLLDAGVKLSPCSENRTKSCEDED